MKKTSKKKTYCDNWTCLTRTCGRHRLQHSGRYNNYSVWITRCAEDCDLYKGPERLATLLNIPESWDIEEEEEEVDET